MVCASTQFGVPSTYSVFVGMTNLSLIGKSPIPFCKGLRGRDDQYCSSSWDFRQCRCSGGHSPSADFCAAARDLRMPLIGAGFRGFACLQGWRPVRCSAF